MVPTKYRRGGAKKNPFFQVKSMETTMCSLICLSRSPLKQEGGNRESLTQNGVGREGINRIIVSDCSDVGF